MGIKQLYNVNLRKLPNEYGDVSVCLRRQNFYEFLKIAIYEKVTTDFENHAKRQTETKVCAFLDMYH